MSKEFKNEETVQIWDYMHSAECAKEDQLPGHSLIGLVIRKSRPEDKGPSGHELGLGAKDCYLVAVPGQEKATYHYHKEWIRKV
jgi:hypothetical protein|tara:strand:+ start:470 stop:721 length:252 start_codon:yes stop_codon:yes gene_type:complete